jgi:xanthosine utilization system XapX-like protein
MANTELIIPIVVALVGLLGSFVGLFMSWCSQKLAHGLSIDLKAAKEKINQGLETHKGEVTKDLDENKLHVEHKQTVSDLIEKYSQPLLVAAYDLQQRLYDLAKFPISRRHLTKPEGLQDLKIFTCYLLAQYLAYTYILRTKLGYLSFSQDTRLKKLRKLMYIIDEELDRRRDDDGQNIGVWPAARILVCERMLYKTDDSHAALDGGIGVEVERLDQFQGEW